MRTLFTLITICLITACGSTQEKKNQSLSDDPSVDKVDQYLAIKDALVTSNRFETSRAASEMLKTDQPNEIKGPLYAIANSGTVAEQRVAFEKLSIELYNLVSTNGAQQELLYKQYCPMAFNNKGAFWLSTEKEILNPYFGDAMLHCGSIQETISQ